MSKNQKDRTIYLTLSTTNYDDVTDCTVLNAFCKYDDAVKSVLHEIEVEKADGCFAEDGCFAGQTPRMVSDDEMFFMDGDNWIHIFVEPISLLSKFQ